MKVPSTATGLMRDSSAAGNTVVSAGWDENGAFQLQIGADDGVYRAFWWLYHNAIRYRLGISPEGSHIGYRTLRAAVT